MPLKSYAKLLNGATAEKQREDFTDIQFKIQPTGNGWLFNSAVAKL